MKNEALYNKTVSILVDAYMNDTLRHSSCYGCAVGNIVASNLGYGIIKGHNIRWVNDATGYSIGAEWQNVFITIEGEQYIHPSGYCGISKIQIDSTGYTFEELAAIEKSFELAPNGVSEDEWMFNGLMAVISVLDIIHENTDTQITTSAKQRFVKQS